MNLSEALLLTEGILTQEMPRATNAEDLQTDTDDMKMTIDTGIGTAQSGMGTVGRGSNTSEDPRIETGIQIGTRTQDQHQTEMVGIVVPWVGFQLGTP